MKSEVKQLLEVNKTMTVTVRKSVHDRVKEHQKWLMGQRANKVSIQEAYIDLIESASQKYALKP